MAVLALRSWSSGIGFHLVFQNGPFFSRLLNFSDLFEKTRLCNVASLFDPEAAKGVTTDGAERFKRAFLAGPLRLKRPAIW